MEENKKINAEEFETKENDCRLSDEELEGAAGGVAKSKPKKVMGDAALYAR